MEQPNMSEQDRKMPTTQRDRPDTGAGTGSGQGAYKGSFTAADLYDSDRISTATHNVLVGYILWIFGFLGAHRFYYGKPVSGTIYFFTLGLLFVGWIVDLFLIPGMARQVNQRFVTGPRDYTIAWLLLTFLGIFGIHRIYLGKIFTAILYFFTAGLFLVGIIYDFWTLNTQISEANRAEISKG
jgi:TM2 domain-containing membrane protein YozV